MKSILLRSLVLLSFSSFLMSPSCDKKEKEGQKPEKTTSNSNNLDQNKKEMIAYNFNGDYKPLWRKVDSLENIGLYESALKEVDLIFAEASKKNDAPQVVKAVIHKMKYNSYLKEDDYIVAINELNSIAKNSNSPLNQLIHSVTADVYWGYYQSNRWKFMNRTQTVNFKNDDVRTWDLKKILSHVNYHYLQSLSNSGDLQRSDIKDFKDILIQTGDSEHLRPTLYDFLAHKAIDYFQNPESGISRPADKFIITGQNYFGDATAFLQVSAVSEDSLSNFLHATRIFKDLTRFHINDKKPEALIDLELRRLTFARNNSTVENKEDLYITALNRLAEKYSTSEAYSEIRFYCATFHQGLGTGYSKQNPDQRWEIKKAVELCEEAISRYPQSYGASQCHSLIQTIQSKEMNFTNEIGYEPGKLGSFFSSIAI
jgi:hypothetical protein